MISAAIGSNSDKASWEHCATWLLWLTVRRCHWHSSGPPTPTLPAVTSWVP